MEFRQRSLAAMIIVALGILAWTDRAEAQPVRAGVVATVMGDATVARASLARPASLKFKDEVYVQDTITTDRDALVRVLLGGKAMVTIREWSVVTITERPGVSTVSVGSGRVGVSVDKSKMRPGDVVDVTTPNAAAAIRGTVIVAEVEPIPEGVRSTITVLTGVIDVTRLDGGRRAGPAISLGALQRVVVQGTGPVGTPTAISPGAARRLGSEFTMSPMHSPHTTSLPTQEAAIEQAVESWKTEPIVSVGAGSGDQIAGATQVVGGASGTDSGGTGSLVSIGDTAVVSTSSGGAVGVSSSGTTVGVSSGGVSVGTGTLGLGGSTSGGSGTGSALSVLSNPLGVLKLKKP